MKSFRIKGPEFKAIQFDGTINTVPDMFKGENQESCEYVRRNGEYIPVISGVHGPQGILAFEGDYLMENAIGGYTIVAARNFEDKYETVEVD